MPSYSHSKYNTLVAETFRKITELAEKKGGEYSGDTDRLLNFRRNGQNLGLPMETVWAVYAGKHWDAIMQFIQDLRVEKTRDRMEPIEGRVDDLIVYLLLFKAMLDEGGFVERPIIEDRRTFAVPSGWTTERDQYGRATVWLRSLKSGERKLAAEITEE